MKDADFDETKNDVDLALLKVAYLIQGVFLKRQPGAPSRQGF